MAPITETRRFHDTVTSADDLRALVGEQSDIVKGKIKAELDGHCRRFIDLAPFALVATADAAGNCDVSPRGDGPGFALVLDDATIALPERPGNRRIDTLTNIVENPHVGLIFLVPGTEETLRVNGRATIVCDADLLQRLAVQGKPPVCAIVIEIDETFFHCAKSFKRAKLWQPESWPARETLPTLGRIIADQVPQPGKTVADLDSYIEASYKKLY